MDVEQPLATEPETAAERGDTAAVVVVAKVAGMVLKDQAQRSRGVGCEGGGELLNQGLHARVGRLFMDLAVGGHLKSNQDVIATPPEPTAQGSLAEPIEEASQDADVLGPKVPETGLELVGIGQQGIVLKAMNNEAASLGQPQVGAAARSLRPGAAS